MEQYWEPHTCQAGSTLSHIPAPLHMMFLSLTHFKLSLISWLGDGTVVRVHIHTWCASNLGLITAPRGFVHRNVEDTIFGLFWDTKSYWLNM